MRGHILPADRQCSSTSECCGTNLHDDHNRPHGCPGQDGNFFTSRRHQLLISLFRLLIPQHCNICISKLAYPAASLSRRGAVERSGNSDVENTAFWRPRGGYLHFKNLQEYQHIALGFFYLIFAVFGYYMRPAFACTWLRGMAGQKGACSRLLEEALFALLLLGWAQPAHQLGE